MDKVNPPVAKGFHSHCQEGAHIEAECHDPIKRVEAVGALMARAAPNHHVFHRKVLTAGRGHSHRLGRIEPC